MECLGSEPIGETNDREKTNGSRIMETIISYVTAIISAASIIAAVTPTPKDDSLVAKVYAIIDLLAVNIGKAKDK